MNTRFLASNTPERVAAEWATDGISDPRGARRRVDREAADVFEETVLAAVARREEAADRAGGLIAARAWQAFPGASHGSSTQGRRAVCHLRRSPPTPPCVDGSTTPEQTGAPSPWKRSILLTHPEHFDAVVDRIQGTARRHTARDGCQRHGRWWTTRLRGLQHHPPRVGRRRPRDRGRRRDGCWSTGWAGCSSRPPWWREPRRRCNGRRRCNQRGRGNRNCWSTPPVATPGTTCAAPPRRRPRATHVRRSAELVRAIVMPWRGVRERRAPAAGRDAAPRAVPTARTLASAPASTRWAPGCSSPPSPCTSSASSASPRTEVALATTLAGAVALLAPVPLGRLADRVGTGRFYVVLLLLRGIGYVCFAFVSDFTGFLVLTVLLTAADRSSSRSSRPS